MKEQTGVKVEEGKMEGKKNGVRKKETDKIDLTGRRQTRYEREMQHNE